MLELRYIWTFMSIAVTTFIILNSDDLKFLDREDKDLPNLVVSKLRGEAGFILSDLFVIVGYATHQWGVIAVFEFFILLSSFIAVGYMGEEKHYYEHRRRDDKRLNEHIKARIFSERFHFIIMLGYVVLALV